MAMLDLFTDQASYGVIDPEFADHLSTETGDGPPRSPPQDVDTLRALMHRFTVPIASNIPTDITQRAITIHMPDGYSTTAIVVTRSTHSHSNPAPLVVLLFGGGFIAGEPLQMIPYARSVARLTNAVVVSLDYRLAPEHPFPTAVLDAYAGLEWCAKHASELGADASKGFVLGGVSAGGNLVAVCTALSVERNLSPKLTGHWVSVANFFGKVDDVPEEYRDRWVSNEMKTVGLTSEVRKKFAAMYQHDNKSPLYNPLLSTVRPEDLPPAYVQVDGMDLLRDDCLIYADILQHSSVPIRVDIYPGLPHSHWDMHPTLKSSRKAMIDIMRGLAWLLGKELGGDEKVWEGVEMP